MSPIRRAFTDECKWYERSTTKLLALGNAYGIVPGTGNHEGKQIREPFEAISKDADLL
jgi:hypothetical protein